jgi:hypothetical protein
LISAAATGRSSDGDANVKAEAGADEIASIAAPANAAANPPTRMRFSMITSPYEVPSAAILRVPV